MANLETSEAQLRAMLARFGVTFTVNMLARACEQMSRDVAPHDKRGSEIYLKSSVGLDLLASRIALSTVTK